LQFQAKVAKSCDSARTPSASEQPSLSPYLEEIFSINFLPLLKGEMHVKLNFKSFHFPLSGKFI
jgi:hypothetical protein